MEISYLGHSCIRIYSNNVTLITDPYDPSLGLSMGSQSADIVTISHAHPNHSNHSGISGDPRILQGPGEYEIANFYITGIGTDRNDTENPLKTNTIFVLRTEGVVLCHLGDLNNPMTAKQIEELNHPDVLFVPVGGVCTLDTERTSDLVNRISPKVVVPIHYRMDNTNITIQPLDPFLDAMGVTEEATKNKLNITATNLPRELKVEILENTSQKV